LGTRDTPAPGPQGPYDVYGKAPRWANAVVVSRRTVDNPSH
jgi:hypothetical protein